MMCSAPDSASAVPSHCSGPTRSMPSTAEIISTVIGDSAMISAMWIAVVDTPAA